MLGIALLLIIILGVLDGNVASVFAGVAILAITSLQSTHTYKRVRKKAFSLNIMVFCGYYIMAFIFSLAFEGGNTFIISDPGRYIADYSKLTSFNDEWQNLYYCYFELSDNNALYNTYLRAVSILGNNVLGGTTVFYLTLAQTMFGIMCMNVLFRILSSYENAGKAYKDTLLFAFLTLYLFYSSVILRDIIIAYLFLLSIEIVLKPFRLSGLIKLIALMIVVWGIRLYSGLFVFSFIGLYVYLKARYTKWKFVILPLFVVLLAVAGAVLIGSAIMEQTTAEIIGYAEMTASAEEQKGGLISYLYKLPPGVSQVAIMFYSQMAPFPSYLNLMVSYSIPTVLMSVVVMTYELFWFFVFYTLLYSFISIKSYRKYGTTELFLFVIAIIYILANTAHPDIRRMMPVYPITYLLYIIGTNGVYPRKWLKDTRSFLAVGYFGLLFVYIMIKGI